MIIVLHYKRNKAIKGFKKNVPILNQRIAKVADVLFYFT
jgi:hypothetical protein